METSSTEKSSSSSNSIAIIAYLTIIGLIIAFIMNKEKNNSFAAYHIKQSLGLVICSLALFVVGLVPILGWIASFLGSLFLLYLWIMGLVNAINHKHQPVPVLGEKFEEWFVNL